MVAHRGRMRWGGHRRGARKNSDRDRGNHAPRLLGDHVVNWAVKEATSSHRSIPGAIKCDFFSSKWKLAMASFSGDSDFMQNQRAGKCVAFHSDTGPFDEWKTEHGCVQEDENPNVWRPCRGANIKPRPNVLTTLAGEYPKAEESILKTRSGAPRVPTFRKRVALRQGDFS